MRKPYVTQMPVLTCVCCMTRTGLLEALKKVGRAKTASALCVHLHNHVIHQGCSSEEVGIVLSATNHQALRCTLDQPLYTAGFLEEVRDS
jgi:hypothetical protein